MGAEANPPTNVEPPGTSAAAAGPNDYAQQWAAAAAMQSYYGVAQQQKQPQNGHQQATQAANAYYAQMAQHPNLYAQMWAGPVRVSTNSSQISLPTPWSSSPRVKHKKFFDWQTLPGWDSLRLPSSIPSPFISKLIQIIRPHTGKHTWGHMHGRTHPPHFIYRLHTLNESYESVTQSSPPLLFPGTTPP